jgi:hypothetical protein
VGLSRCRPDVTLVVDESAGFLYEMVCSYDRQPGVVD